MRVAVGFDHGGYPMRDVVLEAVRAAGHEPIDLGAYVYDQDDDYPDFSLKVGQAVVHGDAERGIIACGSGVGACIAANKIPGVYACVAHDCYSAAQGVEHDNMNVLCLGPRVIGPETAHTLILAFLGAKFSAEPRHHRRVGKIHQIEAEALQGGK